MSDTVCEHCPVGHFSAIDSSTEPCRPHKNCSNLGFKTLRWGTSAMDSLCATQDKAAMLECSHHHTLCHNGETIRTLQLTGLCWGLWSATLHACVVSDISLLGTREISSGRFASRFHTFPNSHMFEHQHRGKAECRDECHVSVTAVVMTRDG